MQKRARAAARTVWAARQRWRWRRWQHKIAPILRDPADWQPLDNDVMFTQLRQEFSDRRSYSYGAWSLWRRGTERAITLLRETRLQTPGARVLEAGCGDGMMAAALSGFGHDLTLVDIDDWRDERARALYFQQANLGQPLPLDDAQFDLVYSYNTFEHLPDPTLAFAEVVRLCKPGGQIYLKFGPLYASAWGLHAYQTLPIPYLQYLFSETFVQNRLAEIGIYDLGGERDVLQPLNRWRLEQFQALWNNSGCIVHDFDVNEELTHLSLVERFPQAFRGRGLTFEDVTTKSVRVRLEKPHPRR